jgi:hypothetical protein
VNLAVLSMFRESTGYLNRYFAQIKELDDRLHASGGRLRVVAIENDSLDETQFRLLSNLPRWPGSRLLTAHDDCPFWPSTDRPERWRHIAWLCNQLLDEVKDSDDVVLYVESDLIWEPKEIKTLVDLVPHVGALTVPNYSKERGGDYYDTWGSRRNGIRFTRRAPYTTEFREKPMLPVDSCASILAVRGEIARRTRFTEDEGFVGWSKQVREEIKLFMLTELAVVHP